jgi:hypothetical protein
MELIERARTSCPSAAFYSPHAWAWKVNPEGDFFAWNPRVDC